MISAYLSYLAMCIYARAKRHFDHSFWLWQMVRHAKKPDQKTAGVVAVKKVLFPPKKASHHRHRNDHESTTGSPSVDFKVVCSVPALISRLASPFA